MSKRNLTRPGLSAGSSRHPMMLGGLLGELKRSQLAGLLLIAVITVISILNAFLYTKAVANPVIRSDGWYLLDTFVSKELDGSLQWSDYFAKRSADESSSPLHKLLLALHVKWFGADYFFESLAGFVGMVVCCFYLVAVAVGEAGRRLRLSDACLICLIPPLFLSLNSTEIYSWSLVTLFYIVVPFCLVLFTVTFKAHGKWGTAAIFVAGFILMVVMEVAGLVVCVAAIIALLLQAIRSGNWRSAVGRALPIVASLVIYHWIYAQLKPPAPSDGTGGIIDAFFCVVQSVPHQSIG